MAPFRALTMRVAVLAGGVMILLTACGGSGAGPSPWAGSTPESTQPLIVALCHGSNQTWPEALPQSYFEALFTETEGSVTIADYWRDISHGKFSIEGSQVLDVQLDLNRDAIGDRDDDDFEKCRDGVNQQYDIDWDVFAGPVVIKPQTTGETVARIDADDTQVQVRTTNPSVMDDWPSAPFTLVLTKNGSIWKDAAANIENVLVTAVSKDYDSGIATFTIEREQPGYRKNRTYDDPEKEYVPPPAKSFESGTTVRDISDIYGSRNRTAVVSVYSGPSTINQELGHFFGFDHSRRLSKAGQSYGDCFDIMSTLSCPDHYYEVSVPVPGGAIGQLSGPGMTSIYLDIKDWIDGGSHELVCTDQATYTMRALGVDGPGAYQVRVPVEVEIRDGVMSEYITIELRSRQFAWDQGIPHDAFVLHLKGDDGIAYLIDDEDAGGRSGMVVGDEYFFEGDPDEFNDDRVFRVASINEASGTGSITVTQPGWDPVLEQDCMAGAGSSSTTTSGDTTTTSDGTTTTTTTDPDELTGAACLVSSTWLLDSQGFLDEIVRVAAEQGSPLPGEIVHAGGTYTLAITDDGDTTMVRDDWSFSVSTAQGTIFVTLDGTQQGSVTYDDTRMEYSESASTVQVTLEIVLDGVRQPLPGGSQPVETDALGGSGTYECVGDTLTIMIDEGDIETVWTRIG